ncbi:MAG: hypothetical protein QOI25_440 [Mycobacterium sp.]|nr:hypothetical protein [Mycobacterium sp.]
MSLFCARQLLLSSMTPTPCCRPHVPRTFTGYWSGRCGHRDQSQQSTGRRPGSVGSYTVRTLAEVGTAQTADLLRHRYIHDTQLGANAVAAVRAVAARLALVDRISPMRAADLVITRVSPQVSLTAKHRASLVALHHRRRQQPGTSSGVVCFPCQVRHQPEHVDRQRGKQPGPLPDAQRPADSFRSVQRSDRIDQRF